MDSWLPAWPVPILATVAICGMIQWNGILFVYSTPALCVFLLLKCFLKIERKEEMAGCCLAGVVLIGRSRRDSANLISLQLSARLPPC